MNFGISWPKQTDYKVQAVDVHLFFNFVINGVTYFGAASAKSQGYDLAEVSIAGHLQSVQGEGTINITSNSKLVII